MGSMGTPEGYWVDVSVPAPVPPPEVAGSAAMDAPARLATDADIDGIAESLDRAFFDDPVMNWLFGATPEQPSAWSQKYFRIETARHLAHPTVYTVDGTSGAALWDPPGHWKMPMSHILKNAPTLLRGMGARIPNALRGLSRIEKVHGGYPDHYYLAVLGTRPEAQGHGIGGRLLQPVLDRCDADGIGAYLESSKDSNIPYYQRHGFEVITQVTFPKGPSVWPMWRDPQPPT